MASDGRVEFDIVGNDKSINATIKNVTTNIQNESKKWDQAAGKATDDMGNAFADMAKKVVGTLSAMKVAQTLGEWGKAAIDAASDLSEVQNVVDVTFGDGARKIESWSKAAGRQFGLTETQAKRFTSTLGAMMKSAGMSGDEIIGMSTDLAGLAADMASFYNLDFETAFQKIRSGISGETEPLKQLGVNMSVANLEAFALEKGISKAFNAMSQSEQTMLRYQYLMQATADAQGDFARTSDGFANATRRVETALETIKTKGGNLLMTVVEPLTTGIAGLLEKMTVPEDQTLFDKVNDIEIDSNKKIAEITKVADTAQGLIDKLGLISGSDAGDAISSMATGANKLNSTAPGVWKSLFNNLKNIDGLQNIFGNASAKQNIEDLSKVLSSTAVDTTKAEAWQMFLGTLSENADAVSKLTGTSVEETKKWLEGLSEAANTIDPASADAWDKLLTSLVQGFSSETPEGKEFLQGLASEFLSLGTESETAIKGLQALGFDTDQIADKQSEWLKVCKELVQTIPGLSEIINTETGEVQGGTGAIAKYVDEWKTAQEKLVYWKAYYAKKAALSETQNSLYSMEISAGGSQMAVDRYLQNNPEIAKIYKEQGVLGVKDRVGSSQAKELMTLLTDAKKAQDAYTTAVEQSAEESKKLANEEQWLTDKFGYVEEAADDAGQAVENFGGKTAEAWQTTTDGVQAALKAMADYVAGVHNATEQAVDGVVKGFAKIQRPTDELMQKRTKLIQQQQALNQSTKEGKKKYEELEQQINELNKSMDQYSPKGMHDALKSQQAFMREYLDNLEKAKGMGLSDTLLASLSDGSVESAEYLAALVSDPRMAESIDRLFQQVQEQKKSFTDELTAQKLAADETYAGLVETAKNAIGEMNLGEEAAAAAGDTVAGLASGISSHVSEVQSAVDSILNELNRLSGWGVNIDLGSFGSFGISLGNIPQHETGLNYVPFDGYLASLHEGEGILTAEENRIWQRFKNGAPGGMDYDTLGNVMRDNVKAGGDVYLDRRIVGQVISEQQGRSYRALQRSGWQS